MNRFEIKAKVFLFFTTGCALVVVLLIVFTKTTTLFKPSYKIALRTLHVGELEAGNGVFLNGIKIGDVAKIELEPDLKHAIVRMQILGDYQIGKNSRFVIHQQGFLGQYYVEVIATSDSKEFLKDGDIVQSEDIIDFVQAGKLTYGLVTRVKEAMRRVEGAMEKSRTIFNSNTFSQVDIIANNFGRALTRGTSVVFSAVSVVESNSPVIDRFLSDVEVVNKDWVGLKSSIFQFTNQIIAVSGKIEPDVECISSNITVVKQRMNQFRTAGETNNVGNATKYTDKVMKILRLTEELGEFSSNLNRIGLVGALRKEDSKRDALEGKK